MATNVSSSLPDSLLEQTGFELSVPLARIRLIFAEEKGLQIDQSGQNRPSVFTGDQRFESRLLQRRVGRTLIIDNDPCRFSPRIRALKRPDEPGDQPGAVDVDRSRIWATRSSSFSWHRPAQCSHHGWRRKWSGG
jgi:hypothetical protein